MSPLATRLSFGLARGIGLALALAVMPGILGAQGVIHTVPPAPLFYSDLPSSQNIDVNNDGIADFNLSSPNGMEIDLTPLNNNGILSVPELPPDIGGWIVPLSPGSRISSSLNPGIVWFDRNYPGGSTLIVACANIGCLGYFQGRTDAYAGIRVESGGNFNYGWLHIQNIGANWGQISEWAYETAPNTPILAGAGIDSDLDGVPDYLDQCPNTVPGAVVDANGCSIDQLCPCDAPWKNHGEYVKTVKSVADQYRKEGRITKAEQKAIVARAAQSNCGKAQ